MPTTARSATYMARRRPVELLARQATAEETVPTWEGDRTAFPGDYVMTGVKDEHWPVQGAEFAKLYDILGPAEDGVNQRVRKKIMDLPVYQTFRPLNFVVGGEDFHASTGYFIISYGPANRYPCEPAVFFETFEVICPAPPDKHFNVESGSTLT